MKFNQALGYHLECPVRTKKKVESSIEAVNAAQEAAATPDIIRPVQSTRSALRYKTAEIISLEQEV